MHCMVASAAKEMSKISLDVEQSELLLAGSARVAGEI